MMKFITSILTICIAATLVGCSTEDFDKARDILNKAESVSGEISEWYKENETLIEEVNNKLTEITSETKEDENLRTVQIPGKEIYVEFADTLRLAQEAYTTLMYADDDAVVGFFSTREDNYSGSLADVIDLAKYEFIDDAGPVSSGWIYGAEIEVVSTESVEIAGRESVRFTGTVLNDGKWECHVYGYTFIIDGVPCAVIGLISDKNQQTEEMIAIINARVDAIAGTIRNTKER